MKTSISASAAGLAKAAFGILEEAAGNRDHGVRRPCSRNDEQRGHDDVRDHTHEADRLEEHQRRVRDVEHEPEAGGGEQEDVARAVLPQARPTPARSGEHQQHADVPQGPEQRDRDSSQVGVAALIDLGAADRGVHVAETEVAGLRQQLKVDVERRERRGQPPEGQHRQEKANILGHARTG